MKLNNNQTDGNTETNLISNHHSNKQINKTLPQKAIYLDSNLSVFSCSYFLKTSSFSSLTALAESFPTDIEDEKCI